MSRQRQPTIALEIRLSSAQIELIQTAAGPLDPAKRELFTERVMARLKLGSIPGSRPSDLMVAGAIEKALFGLMQQGVA
jgi:hypothetical protein